MQKLWIECRMVQFGLIRHRNKVYQLTEISIRVFLLFLFVGKSSLQTLLKFYLHENTLLSELETWTPFIRKIHPEEIWLYRNPMTDSYVPSHLLWTFVTFVPLVTIVVGFVVGFTSCSARQVVWWLAELQVWKDLVDLTAASLVVTLAMPLNGVVTDILKLIVGRPRPDFAFRCWWVLGWDFSKKENSLF